MSQIITTNLRIDKDEWTQLKVLAAELNMSVNQYVLYLLKNLSTRRVLGTKIKNKKTLPIWKLGELHHRENAPKHISSEDRDVYEI